MSARMDRSSRREFVSGLTVAGAAGLLGLRPDTAQAEPPPETAQLRLVWTGSTCQAPQYVADELLRSEGFVDIQYINLTEAGGRGVARGLGAGQADITLNFVGPLLMEADAGAPIVLLAGGHVGCYELFATDRVRTISDLKGKTVAVLDRVTTYAFLASMVSYVGLNPYKDMNVVIHPSAEAVRLLAEGRIDAFLAFPLTTQELKAKKIGRVIINSAVDRPWSQYFCCLIAGNREFIRRRPVATKRAIRAILKAADLCALQPEQAARSLVDKGYAGQYDYALQLMKDVPYGKWREYDPEDTVRFFALRLREAEMIKGNPKKIIAETTDWRFLNELKKELKG